MSPTTQADLVLATTTVAPEPEPELEPTDVTPGVLGFAVTFAVAVAVIGLALSMVVKLRRVNRAEPPDGTETPRPDADGRPGEGEGPRP